MSFDDLPTVLTRYIWKFIGDNITSCRFLQTSKYLHNIGKSDGYIKEIKMDIHTDMMWFINICCRHSNTMVTMYINNINSDFIKWIPIIPQELIIKGFNIIPSELTLGKNVINLKKLVLEELNKKNKTPIVMDLDDFPNLNYLSLKSSRESLVHFISQFDKMDHYDEKYLTFELIK